MKDDLSDALLLLHLPDGTGTQATAAALVGNGDKPELLKQ